MLMVKSTLKVFLVFSLLISAVLAKNVSTAISSLAKNTDLRTDVSIYSFNADSSQVYTLKGGMRLGLILESNKSDDFYYYGKMNIFFEEGSFRSLNDDSFASANTYGVEEAFFKWSPSTYFYAKAGVSKVEREDHSLFINPPALGLKLNTRPFDFNFLEVDTFATINTISNNSTQSRTGKIDGKASYYLLLGVDIRMLSDMIDFKLHYKGFSFNKLTSEYAFKSRFRGSSVTGTGELSSRFTKDYSGHHVSSKVKMKGLYLKPSLRAELISNSDADDQGHLMGLGLESDHFKYKIERFENDPNTLPAAIVSPYYGGTNREGFVTGITYLNKNYQINVDYYTMTTIAASPYQDDLDIIFIEFSRGL